MILALEDEYEGVRGRAAWALGEIGDRRAIEGLTRVLEDEDRDVATKAAQALERIGALREKEDAGGVEMESANE